MDACPVGSAVITGAAQCQTAAVALGKVWGGGSTGECYVWTGGDGSVKLSSDHGTQANFVCMKAPVMCISPDPISTEPTSISWFGFVVLVAFGLAAPLTSF